MVRKNPSADLAGQFGRGRDIFSALFVLIALLGAITPRAAWSTPAKDIVRFSNGDQLSGTVAAATSESISFVGVITKALSLEWSDVREIDLAENTLCVIFRKSLGGNERDTLSLDHATLKVEGTDLVLSSSTVQTRRIPLANLVSVSRKPVIAEPSRQTLLQGWGGQLQSQDSFTASTQHQYQVGAALHVGRSTSSSAAFDHQTTSVDLQANYGESKKPGASPVITQVYEGGIQQDIYLTDNLDECDHRRYGGARTFVVTDFYHNLSLGMNLEQAYGAGLAWDHQQGRQHYGFVGDFRYIGENLYSPGLDQKLAAARLGQNYSIRLSFIKGKPLILQESGSVIPAFNNSRALQARGFLTATVPITPNFSIGIQETDDYLRNAPPNSKQNYSSLQVKFSYSFGASAQ